MDYARVNSYIVFTHDLDFGALVALTQTESPSVVQVRAQNILPSYLASIVVAVADESRILGTRRVDCRGQRQSASSYLAFAKAILKSDAQSSNAKCR